ncbi:MAG: DUF2244 domain-containing protein [Chromatiales bacterium]|jgi:uncharacterized membrane protein
MVTAHTQGAPDAVLVIQPNRNLSWKTTKRVFLFIASCLLIVACYFYSLGAWLVTPFVGLELLIIGLGLYLQCLNAHRQQIIQIDEETISLSDCKGRQIASFPRAWLKVVQTRDPRGWYPSRLFIGSHGRYVEIGKNLVENERNRLADNLRCAIQGA